MRSLPRRSFLLWLSTAAARSQQQPGKGRTVAPEIRRYPDGATEFTVYRLTSPESSSQLTAYSNRSMSGRTTLYFSNDRTGRMEIYRGDLKSGQLRQLTESEALDPRSLALLPGGRSLCFFDGPALKQMNLSSLKEREVYRVPEGVERGRGFSVSSDGARGFFVERSGGKHRLRMVGLVREQPATIVESAEEISDPIARPGQSTVFYRRGQEERLVGYDGRGDTDLGLAAGEVLSPFWAPDGSSLFYLSVPTERGLNTVQELNVATGVSKTIAKTSQFVSFGSNADASVFVGASGSKASPHVLILLRNVRRELTLCEHRAKDPLLVAPMFAPSSQRVVFQSDHQGKPSIYTMTVERFVEETETESTEGR